MTNCFPCLFGRKKTASTSQSGEIAELSSIQNVRIFSYDELKEATQDFSPDNMIGKGGFGVVYKGKLRQGNVAAIKILYSYDQQSSRQFLAEINAIYNIRHENLVRLYGCCVERNQRILVYGYLENNSLAQTLLDANKNDTRFNWEVRRNIGIGIARGLAFLHEELHPGLAHRDIKASNILLDEDLNPKISDFGFAKHFLSNLIFITTRVAGTAHYMAPEYAANGYLTPKADVYSFGVLLLEIVSGRSCISTRLPPEEQYLLERTWELHEVGELANLIDPSLDGEYNLEEACRFLKIGLLCTQETPELRPVMTSVVEMLMGETEVNNEQITRPALVSRFEILKFRNPTKKTTSKESSSSTTSAMTALDQTLTTSDHDSLTAVTEKNN